MKTGDILMTTIKFHKTENAMETSSEKAPYLGIVDNTRTIDTDAFIQEMIDIGGCTENKEAILRVIQSGDKAVMTCVGEHLMKVYTGDGTLVSPYIYGSFDAPDAPVGPGNTVEPQIRLGSDVRDAVADIVPEEDRSVIASLGGVRILSVMTEGVGFGMVKGTLPFCIAGVGFKPSATSTVAVSLTNQKTGVTTAATVVSVDSAQRVNAKMAASLPAGAYRLDVTVAEGSGEEARERSAQRNVTVLAGDEPAPTTITKVTQEGRADDTVKLSQTSPCVVHGSGLALGTGDKVLIELYKNGVCADEGDLTEANKVVSSSATEISLSGFDWNNRTVPDGEWLDAYPRSKLIVVKNGVRYEHPLTFKGE